MKIRSSLRPGHAHRVLLLISLIAAALAAPTNLQAQRPFTIVSVGDSVASGEGNPDVPQEIALNQAYNPIPFLPNLAYDPLPQIPNRAFDPFPERINPNYDPRPRIINLSYQPFGVPAFLAPLLPDFPAYDPNLTKPNPNYDPDLKMPNPAYDPDPLVSNPDYNPDLFTDIPNPEYDPNIYTTNRPAIWAKEADHRSNLAGPALAAAELMMNHPAQNISFFHRAKSGANISDISTQIDKALTEAGGRIDVLMISAGGNNIGGAGFGKLFEDVLESVKGGQRPSQDPELNTRIAVGFTTMSNEFTRLATHIRRCEVGEVFITEYFDLTHGSDGEFCIDFDSGIPGVAFEEMKWAYERIIIPLNQTIQSAAAVNGWHYVGGIAEGFRNHGYCADRDVDARPILPNPDFDPRQNIPNRDYNPIERIPNEAFNPVQNLPNLNYNPVQWKPNRNYDPRANIPNPDFNINPLSPDYDPRITIPNPNYDNRLLVLNPGYNPNPTIPNPDYNPDLTGPNPDYDNRWTVPNPNYNPNLTISNPDFDPVPLDGENWVRRVEESYLLQGDKEGTAHPNGRGQEFYGQRLVEEISAVGLENILLCPEIVSIERGNSSIRFSLSSEYPAESLKLQSASDLANFIWTDESAGISDLGDGMMGAHIEAGSEGVRFFRVVAE